MFEYAYVYDETTLTTDSIHLASLPCSFFRNSIQEHTEFLRLTGFNADLHIFELPDSPVTVLADETMIKRVFNNLFSNIIKYADKKEAVVITASLDAFLTVSLKNKIKTDLKQIESTQIGMKSVQKIMSRIGGSVSHHADGEYFSVTLNFPLEKNG